MPYIKKERREVVDGFKGEYGDLVYFYYKILVDCWKAYPSFGRYFQMKYILPSWKFPSDVDGDIADALLQAGGGFKVPTTLDAVRFAAPYAYDCAVDELKRRYVDKYEDAKIKENGDVE